MVTRRYAADTTVAISRTRAEIEDLLSRFGADEVAIVTSLTRGAAIEFLLRGRRVRFLLGLPDINADEFKRTPEKKLTRTPEQQKTEWDKACRSRWRALLLKIKADLEAVEAGIVSFDVAMYPHLVMPDGRTVSEATLPAIIKHIDSGDPAAPLLALER